MQYRVNLHSLSHKQRSRCVNMIVHSIAIRMALVMNSFTGVNRCIPRCLFAEYVLNDVSGRAAKCVLNVPDKQSRGGAVHDWNTMTGTCEHAIGAFTG